MAVDDRLSDLLVEWEQGRRSGEEPSLEELCRDTPDLLPVLRESIDSLRATDWMFQAERTGPVSESSAADSSRAALHDTELPASHLTVQEFAASIFQSGLLSRDEIEELKMRLDASPLPGEAREIASSLVTEGKLTRYQAAVLLKASKDPLLVDNYVILDTLDTGGMGLVFKALHRSMNRVVALKLLPASMMSARDTVKRFQREVQAAAALKHPNIVAAYDADESAEIAYLVLEYVEGTNLYRLVKESGPRTLAQAADHVRQAAAGLAYLHSRGIIHRDVKPANLILANDGTVKLLDMGLVRFASSEDLSCADMDQQLTQAGIVIGTVAYMSPEQALDTRCADERSDIYSLGCTLFFLLTGRSLYHEETGMKTLLAHREQPVPSIREFCEEAPVSLDAVFRTMVAKRPADRLQTMEEVIAAIDACVPGPAAATDLPAPNVRPLPPASRQHRPRQSRRFRLAALVTAIAAAAIASVYLAVILIRIKTNQGTAEISVDDSNPRIEIITRPESRSDENRRAISGVRKPSINSTELEHREVAKQVQQPKGGPGPMDVEHEVGNWVVTHRGSFSITKNPRQVFSSVPDDEFHVVSISLADPRPEPAGRPQSFRPSFGISDDFVQRLAKLAELRTLQFDCLGVNDSTLEGIHKLKNLESLAVRRACITDAGLRWLEGLKRLRSLDLRDTSVTDAGLKELAKIKLFADAGRVATTQPWTHHEQPLLRLDGTQTTEAGIVEFQRSLPNCLISAGHLMELGPDSGSQALALFPPVPGSTDRVWAEWLFQHLRDCRIMTDADPETWVAVAESLPPIEFHITQIEFGNAFAMQQIPMQQVMQQQKPAIVPLNPVILRHLSDLQQLEGLHLHKAKDSWLMAVATLARLKLLEVASDEVSDDALKAIGRLTHLTDLRVASQRLTDDGVKSLASLHELTSLALTRCRYLHGTGLKNLSGLKTLKAIDLADSAIDDDVLVNVAQFSNLETLNLNGTWISGKGLSQLARLMHLKKLDLARCRRIDDTAFESLSKLKELRELDLGDTRVSAKMVPKLAGTLPNCRVTWPERVRMQLMENRS